MLDMGYIEKIHRVDDSYAYSIFVTNKEENIHGGGSIDYCMFCGKDLGVSYSSDISLELSGV